MLSFKKILRFILPYGIVAKISEKHFVKRSIIQYDESLPEIKESNSKFDYIVSVQGFGFSGSGAVVDFLREFPCCLTLGTIDAEGSKAKGSKLKNGEIDFLRYAGGLFEIEHYLDDNNLFTKDALLERFKRLANGTELFQQENTKRLVNQFYNQLIDFEVDTKGIKVVNGHLASFFMPDTKIKVMRDISLEDYRKLCRNFLTSIFNELYEDNYNYLVLDQLCSDSNYDEERNREYIPNLKTILVYRDPRDTYAYALMKNVPWIPHDSVSAFIKWYKMLWRQVNRTTKEVMILRFEDLVFNYNIIVKKISDYLNLDDFKHTHKLECFDPKESAKNIAIWKNLKNHADSMAKIESHLSEYCFNS